MTAVAIGFVLGYLIGLTGVGGGALVAPALYAILGLGYQAAVSVSLIYAVATKIVSAVQHIRQGSVLWRVTLVYGLLGVPGAILGSRMVYWAGAAGERIFPFIMGGMLAIVASLIVWEAGDVAGQRRKPFSPFELDLRAVGVIGGIQVFVGILLGATSIGAGSIVILSMLFLFRMPAPQVVGSNIIIALIMAVPASATHYAAAGVDWRLLGLLMIGSVFGSILGARSTMLVPEQRLKQAVAGLIYIGAIATFIKAWTG